MAKDPAFLFYPGDWLGGTMTFSRAQKGAYMDLLMAQFSQIALTIEDIKQVLGTDFWMWETKLKFKFETEANSLYFNRKLRTEITRRQLYTASRKTNRTYEKDMSDHMTSHMETGNGIENGDKKRNVFIPPTLEEVKSYCLDRKNGVDFQKWHDFYTGKGWMVGKNKMKDWQAAVRTWESNKNSQETFKKRPAFFLITEYRGLKWEKQRIKDELYNKGYSEFEIEEGFHQSEKDK